MGARVEIGATALAAGAVLWVALIVSAPLAIASTERAVSMGAAIVYGAGARVCHQRPERCFWTAGRPLPVCARCTGLYAGGAIGASAALLLGSALSGRRARVLAILAALPTLATWSLEATSLAHPSNIVRAIAALPLGLVAAWLVITALVHEPPHVRADDRMP